MIASSVGLPHDRIHMLQTLLYSGHVFPLDDDPLAVSNCTAEEL